MKLIKRIALLIVVLLFVLIGSAMLIPVFFKDKITAFAKEEINNAVHAKVDFADASLSLIRNFPNLRFGLEEFSLEGLDEFEGVKLATANSFDLVLDLMSVFSSDQPLQLQSIFADQPKVHIIVLENGKANYDIALPDTSATEAPADDSDIEGFILKLKNYGLQDASFIYDDRQTGTYVEANNLDHSGSGEFTLNVFDLDTKTNVEDLTVRYGGINYLLRSKADLDAIFNIDQKQAKYTLKENNLRINDLLLNADGFVQLEEENINMDLSIATPQNDFKNLLSLIPNAYIQGYENVKAAGDFALSGNVKGTYNGETAEYPSFKFAVDVKNGTVQYPDLPMGISDINADVQVDSPTSDFDDMKVDIPQFNVKIGNNPIQGRFALKTPISDPDVDTKINGKLDLDALSKAFPVEGIKKMAGIIQADITARTRMSYLDRGQYDRVAMQGNITGERIIYDSEDYPVVAIKTVKANLSPQRVTITDFDSRLGKSDLKASGTIDNILAYFSPKKTMKGKLTFSSNLFDANEWNPASTTADPQPMPVANAAPDEESETYDVFDRFDFTIDGTVNEIDYADYQLKNMAVSGHMLPNKLTVSNLSGQLKNSDFKSSGQINNIFDYLFEKGILTGNINVQSNNIDLNEFMTTTTTDGTEAGEATELEAVLVPENIDMDINANIGSVKYGKINLRNVNGKMAVENRSVLLDGVTADGLGGKIAMSGSYDTPLDEQPGFSFKYDLQSLDFQQTFNGVNTFQQLAPISKFINGQFTSSLIMDAKLGKNLMPDLGSINAKGFLETINGVVKGYKPLQAIGNTLDIKELKESMPIGGTKNWFEIQNGVINVQEFDYQLGDIAMKIGGSYGLDQSMNYNIKAQVPREKLGSTVGKGLDALSNQAQKLGLNVGNAEFVNLGINLTGKTNDPKVNFKLLGVDGQTSVAEAAKEQVQEQVKEKVAEGKAELEEKKEEIVDSVKTVVQEKVEAVKEEAAQKAKDVLKDKLGNELGKGIDSTLLPGVDTSAVDNIKKELEKFNPFKKKKKKNN